MGVVIDIIGSFIVRAAIVGMILQLMISLSDALYRNTERLSLNEESNNISKIISSDIKLAGFGRNTIKRMLTANSNDIRFYTDFDDDGAMDQIRFYLGSGSNSTTLYRTWSYGTFSQTLEVARNVSRFVVRYYTINGTAVSGSSSPSALDVGVVKSILVTIEIDSPNKFVGAADSSTFIKPHKVSWEQHIFPPNL